MSVIPPVATQSLYVGVFLWFVALVFIAAAIALRAGVTVRSRAISYAAAVIFLAIMLGFIVWFVIPGAMRGEGIGALIFILLLIVGGSSYSYFSRSKQGKSDKR